LYGHKDSSSGVHGRNGELVGDSDTQTLSNKTLDGPSWTGSWQNAPDAGGNKLTGLGTPDSSDDAATKQFCEDLAIAPCNTNATSTSSLTIGTGSKSLTVETDKDFVVGMYVIVAYTSSPTTYMAGTITSYDSGTGALDVNVNKIAGSGTYSDWTVSLSGIVGISGTAAGAATKLDQSSDITLGAADSQAQSISFTGVGYSVTLPDATGLSSGLPFILMNEGSYKYGVRDNGGNLVDNVDTNVALYCFLVDNSTANGTWRFDPVVIDRALPITSVSAFNSTSSSNLAIVNLDDSTLIVAYQEGSNSYGEVIALSASDGSVLDGPVTFNSTQSQTFAGDKLTTTEAFFCYQDSTNGDFEAIVVEYSSGTLSVAGGPTQIDSNDPNNGFGCATLDSFNVGVPFCESTNNDVRAMVVNWDGSSTISVSAGPTQLNADRSIKMECILVDSNNFLAITEQNSDGDLYAYSINWDGSSTISQNGSRVEIADSVSVRSIPQLALLEDDGTYLWIAAVFQNNDNSNKEADIAVCKVTKSDATVADSINVNKATSFNSYYGARYHAFMIGSILYFTSTNTIASDGYITYYKWDKSGPTLTKITEEEFMDAKPNTIAAALINTQEVMLAFRNLDNNSYGSTIKLEVVK